MTQFLSDPAVLHLAANSLNDRLLLDQIKVAAVAYALLVSREPKDFPNHLNRAKYARRVLLDADSELRSIAFAALVDGLGIRDDGATVQAKVCELWNPLSGVV